MKKLSITLVLIFVFSIFVFADGQMGTGKTCNGVCLTSNPNEVSTEKGHFSDSLTFFLKKLLAFIN